MKELPSQYIASDYEDRIYKMWEQSGAFAPENQKPKTKNQKAFSIVMPPPNVTGTLHIGHAVMLALEDIMVRYHRMKGAPTVWIPGTDHAAIATQTVVEKKLKKEQNETRHRLGREKFLEEVQKFVDASKERIHLQIRKMGASCDWSREAYTLDEPRTRAVRTAFEMLWKNGLIYRGNRVVNWCPRCKSTLSDDEVEYKEEKTILYTFRYDENWPEDLAIATTRPETKFGDTAVALHPDDPRTVKYGEKVFRVQLAKSAQEFNLRVITDPAVDRAFGTGAVGITPAHSFVDAEIAERHKLPARTVIDEDGDIFSPDCGEYVNLSAREAREKLIEELRSRKLILDEKPITHNLLICYRCSTPVEPLPKRQWFIAVNKEFKFEQSKHAPIRGLKDGQQITLKILMLHVVEAKQIKILPEYLEKTYFQWIHNLRDWCISRQIWFGHQIPVWYHSTCQAMDEHGQSRFYEPAIVGEIKKDERGLSWCKNCQKSDSFGTFLQDPDTLDTWFSSGLWTFSTLGWPDKTKDFEMFHPTAVLETGYDILFFWIARMILMSTALIGEIPFRTVYLHGLVRDMQGRKMSKSIGNVIDPLDMIAKYGADAVRISLFMGTSAGTDVKLNEQKIAGYRNFANKIWNASRFVLMNLDEQIPENPKRLSADDKKILTELKEVVKQVTVYLDKFDFNHAGNLAYHYFWHTFCDKIIEAMKPRLGIRSQTVISSETQGEREISHATTKQGVRSLASARDDKLAAQYLLLTILTTSLKLLHPFMPFVTEAVWQNIPKEREGMLILERWPNG